MYYNCLIYFFVLLLICLKVIYTDFISLVNEKKCNIDKTSDLNMTKLNLYFYDYGKEVYINGSAVEIMEEITRYIRYDTTRRLVVYIPGYPSDLNGTSAVSTTNTFQKAPNTYLLIIDYSTYAHPFTVLDVDDYFTAVYYAHAIGNAAGKLIAQINKTVYPTKNIYVLGFSFGAQILGYIGDKYHEETNERIPRITGIDPAAPCFAASPVTDQLRSGVADHVEVYHCSELGSRRNLSDAEYYLDPYVKLPGCKNVIPDLEQSCVHTKCIQNWLTTVVDPGRIVACSPEDFKGGCQGGVATVAAGYSSSANVTGVYYASTVYDTSNVDSNANNDIFGLFVSWFRSLIS